MALFSRLASRPRSVRTRLMLWNAASLAVILTIGGGIIQYTVKTNLLASVDHDLALRAVPHIPHPPGAPLFETVRNDERKWFAMGPRSGAGPFGWLPSLDPTTQEERQFQESARKQFM